MGKGGGGTTPAGRVAGNIAEEFARLSGPARQAHFRQLKEALTTGAIAQRAPIIQQMVERGLQEGSRAEQLTTGGVARLGGAAGRSPAIAEARAAQQALAQQAVAEIPGQVVGATALRAPQDVVSAMNASNAFLGTAGLQQGTAMQASAANAASTNATIGSGVGAAASVAAAVAIIVAL